MSKKQPYVLSIDTDKDFNKKFTTYLEKLGVSLRSTTTLHPFLATFGKDRPAVCIVEMDLNNDYVTGVEIVKTMRSKFGRKLPLLVLSRRSLRSEIDEIIKAGADDYILKPIDNLILESKLKAFLQLDADSGTLPLLVVPENRSACDFTLSLKLLKLTEKSITWSSPNYVSSRGTLSMTGPFIRELTLRDRPLVLNVSSTESKKAIGLGSYFEVISTFDEYDTELMTNVRIWLESNQ